jgi:hypothetical protein
MPYAIQIRQNVADAPKALEARVTSSSIVQTI